MKTRHRQGRRMKEMAFGGPGHGLRMDDWSFVHALDRALGFDKRQRRPAEFVQGLVCV